MEKDPVQPNGPPQTSLVEIGPRFVLTPIRMFEGAFGGATVFSNPGTIIISLCVRDLCIMIGKEFISPSAVRSALRRDQSSKYNRRKEAEVESTRRKELRKRREDDLAVAKVFA
jgi:ribosome biogenesis protein BRX1